MRIHHIAIIIIFSGAFFSCRKFVEIDTPNNQIVTNQVFEKDETAIAALTSIYSRMNADPNFLYRLSMLTACAADELKSYSTSKSTLLVYTNNVNPIDALSFNFWQSCYTWIYQANAVWEGCDQSKSLSPAVKKQLMAEARFIRAFLYFNLTNLYGNIPLITSTDYTISATAVKVSQDAIFDQAIADLTEAEANLNSGYVNGNSISTGTDRVRPNRYAAAALLARVYLYAGKYQKAEEEATKVISNKTNYELVPIANTFLKGMNESIWQLMRPTPNTNPNTFEGQNFILTSKPTAPLDNVTISDQLLSSFEGDDQRKTTWIGKYTDASVNPKVDYYFVNKYKVKSSSAAAENTILLRVAEQLLIRAEARAQNGNIEGAKEDLNAVRKRAGLGDTPAGDKPALLAAVFKERQVELFTEYGHRWFDLRRTGNIDQVMLIATPAKGGVKWNNYQKFWPIPNSELQKNPYLKQNQGYE